MKIGPQGLNKWEKESEGKKQECEDVEVRGSLRGGTLSSKSSFPIPDWPCVFTCRKGPISGLQLKLRRAMLARPAYALAWQGVEEFTQWAGSCL